MPQTTDFAPWLAATPFIDHEHPSVRAYAEEHALGSTPREQAVALCHAVRDGFRYNPYDIQLSVEGLSASSVLARGQGWCVNKAVLLAAVSRARGIPARLGFADVRNHLTSARLRASMGTDVFHWHGYTELWLQERWVKATPAFNIELCEKLNLAPLDFDGVNDSLYHAADRAGQRHMEYLRDRGHFADVPIDEIRHDFEQLYRPVAPDAKGAGLDAATFQAEAQRPVE
jgi:transglutaminase-like putative cysteine protease